MRVCTLYIEPIIQLDGPKVYFTLQKKKICSVIVDPDGWPIVDPVRHCNEFAIEFEQGKEHDLITQQAILKLRKNMRHQTSSQIHKYLLWRAKNSPSLSEYLWWKRFHQKAMYTWHQPWFSLSVRPTSIFLTSCLWRLVNVDATVHTVRRTTSHKNNYRIVINIMSSCKITLKLPQISIFSRWIDVIQTESSWPS